MPFQKNVFINCPFDNDYRLLLKPLLFTILYLGYRPNIARTQSSSDIRINQIKSFIKDSKFGIHDLSRCRPLSVGELPRFNMPYELGLDMGCIEFGSRKSKSKKILILEKDKFHYQKVLSDIAGQDIENHEDDPKTLVQKVRNWFSTLSPRKSCSPTTEVWAAYNQCSSDLIEDIYSDGKNDNIPIEEYLKLVKRWITSFKS
jgi:hypothetical protein